MLEALKTQTLEVRLESCKQKYSLVFYVSFAVSKSAIHSQIKNRQCYLHAAMIFYTTLKLYVTNSSIARFLRVQRICRYRIIIILQVLGGIVSGS